MCGLHCEWEFVIGCKYAYIKRKYILICVPVFVDKCACKMEIKGMCSTSYLQKNL